jgi:hypothetical protein
MTMMASIRLAATLARNGGTGLSCVLLIVINIQIESTNFAVNTSESGAWVLIGHGLESKFG